jgi:hypothetical protein
MTMSAEPSRLRPNVKRTIERILRERLSPFGLARTDIRSGVDHDGDDVIFVDAYYELVDRAVEPKSIYGLESLLRDALAKLGETRFPHVRHHFDEHQKIAS